MSTIPSTKEEFMKDCAKFTRVMGDKRHTQAQVSGAHKALTLRYLGLTPDTPSEDVELCAMHLKIATEGAMARGWELGS